MAEVQILTDTFHRANTSTAAAGTTTGAGNSWIDEKGFIWNIASNQLTGFNTNNPYRQWLMRPSTEDLTDERIVANFTFGASGGQTYVLLRANPTTYDSYAAYFNSSFQLKIVKLNGSAQTETALATVSKGSGLTVGTAYILDFKVVGTQLTAVLYAASAPTTPLVTAGPVTDSSFAGPGSFGISNFFAVAINSVTTYNENAPVSTAITITGPTTGIVNSASTAFTIALSPSGSIPPTDPTTVTPSDGGAGGTFTPTTLTLASGTQTNTFTYTPTTSGHKTLTITNNGSLTNPSSIDYLAQASALASGTISTVSVTSTTISLSATASSGGTGALTYQWYRSTAANLTPGSGNIISGATGLTLNDTGLTISTLYFYKLVTTDSLSVTSTTAQYIVSTVQDTTALTLGFIGDSQDIYMPTETVATSGGTSNPPIALGRILSILTGNRPVTIINRAVAGQRTQDWVPATSQYINAKAAFVSAGATHIFIKLGANDSRTTDRVTPATYLSNMTSIVNDLLGSGFKVILNYPTYTVPGSFSGAFDEVATGLAQQYAAQLLTLVNGTTVLQGTTLSYQYFAIHQDELIDGVHFLPRGVGSQARLYAQASAADLLPIGPMFINVGGIAKSLTPYKG